MAEKLICPICGEVTSSYMGHYRKDRLCKKHSIELKNGTLLQCDKCDTFHYVGKPCKCRKKHFSELPTEGFDECVACGAKTTGYAFCRSCFRNYTEEEMLNILNGGTSIIAKKNKPEEDIPKQTEKTPPEPTCITDENKTVVIDYNNKSKCITCGRQTDGLLFCGSCYHKYKDKELLFKITKCTSVELLDELIDDYLFDNRIQHAYERAYSYGATEKEVLYPDFYLPNYLGEGKHVYIEHWGYNENNIQYTKTKKFKISIYREKKITLICTYEKTDMGEIDSVLERKLNKEFIKEGQINYEEVTSDTEPTAHSSNKRSDGDLPF